MPPTAVITGAGATVSSTKVALRTALRLPTTSRAVADTVTVPLPRVSTSSLVSTTACAVPVLVKLRVMVPAVPVRETEMVEAASALTRTTPPDWVASARVAPLLLETPVPKVRVGWAGPCVSIVAVYAALAVPRLPSPSSTRAV